MRGDSERLICMLNFGVVFLLDIVRLTSEKVCKQGMLAGKKKADFSL